ncbi:MAG: site-specific integrase [Lentisphaerae bacterium]|nr:site-specific integrase [Lentisphaerota bacterium]
MKQIPMLPAVQEILRRRADACRSPTDHLFANPIQSKYATPGSRQDGDVGGEPARRLLKRYLRKAGITPSRDMLWHAFRRYFVRKCVQKGVPLNILMTWTGHDTVTMALHSAKETRREESSREIDRLLA